MYCTILIAVAALLIPVWYRSC